MQAWQLLRFASVPLHERPFSRHWMHLVDVGSCAGSCICSTAWCSIMFKAESPTTENFASGSVNIGSCIGSCASSCASSCAGAMTWYSMLFAFKFLIVEFCDPHWVNVNACVWYSTPFVARSLAAVFCDPAKPEKAVWGTSAPLSKISAGLKTS